MERNHHTKEWSRRRTQALLRLFKTQAPPDFREQVLRRAHAHQRVMFAQDQLGLSRCRVWQLCRTELLTLWHRAAQQPGTVVAVVSTGAILLSVGMLWWGPPAHLPQLVTAQLPTEVPQQGKQTLPTHTDTAQMASHSEALFDGGTVDQPAGVAPQSLAPRLESLHPASPRSPETRASLPPAVPPVPWTAMEVLPPLQNPAPRLSHKRPSSVKGKRVKKTLGPGKQAST